MNPTGGLFIGIMSGTSLDGIDTVLADFDFDRPLLRGHVHHGLAQDLRHELLLLCTPGPNELHRAAVVAQHLARAYADTVAELLRRLDMPETAVRAIGVHGQTVRHQPMEGYTLQLNAPALLAELSQIDVIADFRSRDVAAGGQGAPLVPAFHKAVFSGPQPRAIVNLGGFSNLTALPGRDDVGAPDAAITGFDCGPGNVLIDAWAQRHLQQPFDAGGAWSGAGRVDPALLAAMLAEPFFAEAPPKSTGRELFDAAWIDRHVAGHSFDARDVAATLTRLTAGAIGSAIARYFPTASEVLLCGGGVFNAVLVRMIEEECAPRPVRSTAALGVAPEHVEAMAFAWLAREHLLRRPANLPAVTGAQGGRILGALYPA